MIIYHYHPTTGEFLGSSRASANPLEPGKHLVPAYATPEAPPAVGDNEAAVFVDDGWGMVPDHRGVVYYTAEGKRVTINALSETPPDDALTTPPAGAETPAEADEWSAAERIAQVWQRRQEIASHPQHGVDAVGGAVLAVAQMAGNEQAQAIGALEAHALVQEAKAKEAAILAGESVDPYRWETPTMKPHSLSDIADELGLTTHERPPRPQTTAFCRPRCCRPQRGGGG